MKLGTDNSKKTIGALALFAIALFLTIRMLTGFSSGTGTAASTSTQGPQLTPTKRVRTARGSGKKAANEPATPSLDPRLHLDELKQAEGIQYEGMGRNPFVSQPTDVAQIEQPKGSGFLPGKGKTGTTTPPPQAVVTAPQAPPINLKFYGFASGSGQKQVFLSQGDDIFVAKEGDIVNRRYKIVRVNANSVEVQDVLNNSRQTIPLTAG